MEIEAQKKLEEYEQSRPDQLSLFYFTEEKDQKYSNSIELYDAIPKYYWGNQKRKDGKYLEPIEREFIHKNNQYIAVIQPAKIRERNGVYRDYLPSQREELVEDALRKLACDGRGIFLDGEMGVVFSLYELQKELQKKGHGYKIVDIKKAIMICGSSTIQLQSQNGRNIILESFFTTVGLRTQDDWKEHGRKSQAFIRFNSLVTQSIRSKTFRQLNYDTCMSYKKILARWLHKKMSHNYTQASISDPYTIKLSTIIRDSGVTRYKNLRDNLYKVKEALEEMKDKNVVSKVHNYKIEEIKDSRQLKDVKFTITPTHLFAQESKTANIKAADLKRLGQDHSKQYSQNDSCHSKTSHISDLLAKKFK